VGPALRFGDLAPDFQFFHAAKHFVAVAATGNDFLTPSGFAFGTCSPGTSTTATPASIIVASTFLGVGCCSPCVVTATLAPVSMSTASSTLKASAVRRSLSRVISDSSSLGLTQSWLDIFLGRFRSIRSKAAASDASTPSAAANRFK
jgi:hypothetical protein